MFKLLNKFITAFKNLSSTSSRDELNADMSSLKIKKRDVIKPILVVLAWILVSILFLHDYNRYPFEGYGEEQAFSWAGFSYLKEGSPTSWTHFDYPSENNVFKGVINGASDTPGLGVKLVKPWFDHPPLFSILAGIGPYLAGFEKIEIFPNSLVRIPNAVAFTLTLLALYIFADKLFGWKVALLSMTIFGSTPIFVFAGRIAVPEVVFALFYLLMFLLWMSHEKSNNKIHPFLIGCLAGIAGLMKITGFLLLPLFIFFALKKKDYKSIAIMLITQIPFLVILYAYANSLDLNLFLQLLSRQGFRPIGWSTLVFVFGSPGFGTSTHFDGWYVLALISSILLLFSQDKSINLIKWGIFYWFTVLIFTSGQQDMLPWYRFTMYPLLAISLSLFLRNVYRKPEFGSYVLIAGTLLSARYYLANAFHSDILPGPFRTRFIALMLPILLLELNLVNQKLMKFIVRAFIVFIVATGILFNSKYIYSVYAIRCESTICPIGPGNKVSELRYPFFWRLLVP